MTNDDDEEQPVAPQKKRRFSLEVEPLPEESAARRASERVAKNEKEREKTELQKKLQESERVTSSLFKKLEQVERRADNAEDKLAELEKTVGKGASSSAGVSKSQNSATIKKALEQGAKMRATIKTQKDQIKCLKLAIEKGKKHPVPAVEEEAGAGAAEQASEKKGAAEDSVVAGRTEAMQAKQEVSCAPPHPRRPTSPS